MNKHTRSRLVGLCLYMFAWVLQSLLMLTWRWQNGGLVNYLDYNTHGILYHCIPPYTGCTKPYRYHIKSHFAEPTCIMSMPTLYHSGIDIESCTKTTNLGKAKWWKPQTKKAKNYWPCLWNTFLIEMLSCGYSFVEDIIEI